MIMPRVPRKKVEKVVKGILEGKTQGQAMKDAGYSESYSRTPQVFKKNRSLDEILASDFSDEFIAKKQKKLMNVKKIQIIKFPAMTPDNEINQVFELCDGKCLYIGDEVRETAQGMFRWRTGVGYVLDIDMFNIQVDRIYKLKGQYKNGDFVGNINWNTMTLADLEEQEKKIEEEDKLFNERYSKYAPTKGVATKKEGVTASEGSDTTSEKKGDSKVKDTGKV